jgi:hypothetical protein
MGGAGLGAGGAGLGAGGGLGVNAGAGSGPMSGGLGASVRDSARINSQGSINANSHALDRANSNSALSVGTTTNGTARTTTTNSTRLSTGGRANAGVSTGTSTGFRSNSTLTGLTSGMNVVDSTGATVGTITRIDTKGNGSIRDVQVTLTNGQVITLAPSSLSLANGVLTTNSLTTTANGRVNSQGPAHASIQGLTHASPNSVLSSAGVTTLTGLTTGLTVNNSAGTSIGTVSNIITNRAGGVVAVQVDLTSGGTVTIPSSTLSMNGTTVVTTSTVGG